MVNIRLYHHIMSRRANGDALEDYALSEMLWREPPNQSLGILASQQQRSDIEDHTVGQVVSDQRGIHRAAAFDKQTGDPQPSQLPAEIREGDASIPLGKHQHIDAPPAEQMDLSNRRCFRGGNQGVSLLQSRSAPVP